MMSSAAERSKADSGSISFSLPQPRLHKRSDGLTARHCRGGKQRILDRVHAFALARWQPVLGLAASAVNGISKESNEVCETALKWRTTIAIAVD
jgi:hypothetical protein